MTRPVEYSHGWGISVAPVTVFHGASRKGAKDAKFGEICTMHFSLRPN